MKEWIKKIKSIDYRHYISAGITIIFALITIFVFPSAFKRLGEAFRDFGTSFCFYVAEIFGIPLHVAPTVNAYSSVPWTPVVNLPETWEEFTVKWNRYWEVFVTEENLIAYLEALQNVVFYASRIIMILVVPLILAFYILFQRYFYKENVDDESESKPLQFFKKMSLKTYHPAKRWMKGFIDFNKENATYWKLWLLIWAINFNVITIIVEFLAYYLYFVVSFDLKNLYRQVYKLFCDLSVVIAFVPLVAWIALIIALLEARSRKVGYENLSQYERRNRGFINELGIVTYIYAEMGEGKTTMLTDMALSNEVQLRDDALEVILECDMCFPHFPWFKLEKALKEAYGAHVVYDKWSCIRFTTALKERFLQEPCEENIFGYEYGRYPLTFDNKLYVEDIWQTIEDYALAYTIYTTQSALIISNYAIRVDSLMNDLGNFPVWDCDFFKRDSRLIDSFSRHSHILDWDMLRFGNQMLKDNPNRYAFGWGVWVGTELDKEAKNTLEQQEMKANVEECNQKNDLMHVLFKMSRHACMVRHRNFVRILADMQRVENITANLRQIGNVALIAERGPKKTALPFYSPYRMFSPALMGVKERLDGVFVQERFLRSDKRLITNLLERLRSVLGRWNMRTVNMYGTRVLHIEMQSGRMDGSVRNCKYYISDKKAYSKRNGSDCMVGTFKNRGELNTIGLDDMREFADYIATQDELLYENSYTQKELRKYEGNIEMEKKTDIKAVDKLLSSAVEGLMAMQNGKINVSEETKGATQTLVKELCSAVALWADDEDEKKE